MTSTPPPTPAKPQGSPRSHVGRYVVVLVVVIIIVVAGVAYYLSQKPPSAPSTPAPPPPLLIAGGFTAGQVVTFTFNGSSTFQCTPAASTFYPNASAATGVTPCEFGKANQNAVGQVPQWLLIPAFAGSSVFGLSKLGANASGFPVYNGATLLTDCGGAGSQGACGDQPNDVYSPSFVTIEQRLNITTGVAGLPEGVLPLPAHDTLLNTTTTFPLVEWGTIVVFVFDPNIWPGRSNATCSPMVASNLSSPTGDCLTSWGALAKALVTSSSSVSTANHGNPIWEALGSPTTQVVVPGDLTVAELNNLDANLYIPYSVAPGAPSTFPS